MRGFGEERGDRACFECAEFDARGTSRWARQVAGRLYGSGRREGATAGNHEPLMATRPMSPNLSHGNDSPTIIILRVGTASRNVTWLPFGWR